MEPHEVKCVECSDTKFHIEYGLRVHQTMYAPTKEGEGADFDSWEWEGESVTGLLFAACKDNEHGVSPGSELWQTLQKMAGLGEKE